MKQLDESSLSRLWSHNLEHDCGALTAFRKYTNCGFTDSGEWCSDKEPVLLTKKDNTKRNLALAADLKKAGYGITKIVGSYPEGGTSVKEISYFVVDLKDSGKLKKDLIKLGEKYDQDSILFIPQGAINNTSSEKAKLYGTNSCCNNWIGKGKTVPFAKGSLGVDSPIYTSFVGGRPFIFESAQYTDEIFGSSTSAILADRFSRSIKTFDEFISGED